MRATIADLAAKMKRWDVCVTMNDEQTMETSRSPFARLPELLREPTTTLLMVLATGAHHFNALDQLSRACAQQCMWSAVLKPATQQGVKQLVVYVPRDLSADSVVQDVHRLAVAIQLAVHVNVVNCENVPQFVVDALVSSLLVYELETACCTVLGETSERQFVLSPDLFATELSTVAVPHIHWHYDPYRQMCSFEMACIPVMMKLRSIAEDSELCAEDEEEEPPSWSFNSRVRVLPRLSEGWIISRSDKPDFLETSRHEISPAPRTEDEFRSYWLQVHGIRLPERFGGYVRVRFSSNSILTYPACCVATEWSPLHKQSRVQSIGVIRQFTALLRKVFGERNVSLTSPNDIPERSAPLLPASALLEAETLMAKPAHESTSVCSKRRMIGRGRYTVP